ncbi:unnamed protein product, partial [Allacma fusca]
MSSSFLPILRKIPSIQPPHEKRKTKWRQPESVEERRRTTVLVAE